MGIAEFNEKFAQTKVGKYFQIKERGSTLTTEFLAGLTTFATLCYVLPGEATVLLLRDVCVTLRGLCGRCALRIFSILRYHLSCFQDHSSCFKLTCSTTACGVLSSLCAVNSDILSVTGGPCPGQFPPETDFFVDEDYLLCVQAVKKSLLTATAASSAIACFLMGIGANMPIQLGKCYRIL